jgi:hypothetical protein
LIQNEAANAQKMSVASVVLPPIDKLDAAETTRRDCLDFVTVPDLVRAACVRRAVYSHDAVGAGGTLRGAEG